MKEDYVSFEVAKLLREKGFDEKCIGFYSINGKFFGESAYRDNWTPDRSGSINAPTCQMAMKWLRERPKIAYNILILSDVCLGELYYSYEIQEIDNDLLKCNGSLDQEEDVRYETYEDAVEAALLYILKNLI